MKIVIDTNVLISATFFSGIPRKVIDLVLNENVAAYTNTDILSEYEGTAFDMVAKNKGHINQTLFDRFLNEVNVIDAETVVDVCRDPDDNINRLRN